MLSPVVNAVIAVFFESIPDEAKASGNNEYIRRLNAMVPDTINIREYMDRVICRTLISLSPS